MQTSESNGRVSDNEYGEWWWCVPCADCGQPIQIWPTDADTPLAQTVEQQGPPASRMEEFLYPWPIPCPSCEAQHQYRPAALARQQLRREPTG